jgi:hypothetical protein
MGYSLNCHNNNQSPDDSTNTQHVVQREGRKEGRKEVRKERGKERRLSQQSDKLQDE